MATFKTDYRTTQEDNPRGLSIFDKQVMPQLYKVEYTIPSGFASGDSIEVLDIPKGTIILPTSTAHVEAMGAGITLSMGKSTGSTSLINAADVSADALVFLDASPETRASDFNNDDANIVYAHFDGGTPTDGSKVIFYLYLANNAI